MKSISILGAIVVLLLSSVYAPYSLADQTGISSIFLLPEYELSLIHI